MFYSIQKYNKVQNKTYQRFITQMGECRWQNCERYVYSIQKQTLDVGQVIGIKEVKVQKRKGNAL